LSGIKIFVPLDMVRTQKKMKRIIKIAPQAIEAESFRIIEAEIGAHGFSEEEFAVVRRVIHATGDFAYAGLISFSPGAVAAGIDALRQGMNVVVDTGMAAAGVSGTLLAGLGGRVIPTLAAPGVAEAAKAEKKTRSEIAIRRAVDENTGIVAIGNAPTALIELLRMAQEGIRPPLVIGMPVGFVNAAESKELLTESPLTHITVRGRKGGTPAAVAAVNAIIRMAVQDSGARRQKTDRSGARLGGRV